MRTRSLLRPRVGAVLALVDPALRGHVLSVHDFRVAGRSLRAALRTLTKRPGAGLVRRTKHGLRNAIRALADVRDRDVGRVLLMKLAAGSAIDAGVKRRVIGLSESDRRLALTRAVAGWPKGLDRLLIALLGRSEPSVETVIRRTRAEAWQQRRRAIDLIDELGRLYRAERLHDLRRRVRSLRYAIEVMAEVDSGAGARLIRIKPLQSVLGDAQDRIVLSRWLGAQAVRFRRSDAPLSKALRIQAARFRAQAVRAHASFLKLKPKRVLEGLALHVDARVQSPTRDRPAVPAIRSRGTAAK